MVTLTRYGRAKRRARTLNRTFGQRSRGAAGLAAMLWVAVVLATPALQAAPLSLQDAVDRAVAEHPALEAATRRHEVAEAGAAQASTGWYPRITVDAKYRFAGPVPSLEIDTGIAPPGGEPIVVSRELGSYHFASVGTTAMWRIYDFGSRDYAADAAQTAADASGLEREIQAAEIAYAVRASYLALVFAGELEGVTQRSLETAQAELAQRETLLRLGAGPEVEVAASRARVAELEARLVDIARDKTIAEGNLRSLLNLEPNATIEPTDTLEQLAGSAPVTPEVSPSLERLALLEEASTQQAEAIDRSFWPTLDAFATVDFRYPRTFAETDAPGVNYAAGVSLTWLVFDGGLIGARSDEARARSQELISAQAAMARDIERQAAEADVRRTAAADRIPAAQAQMQAAADYLRAAEGAREAGVFTEVDVALARERVEGAELGLSRAFFDQAMAHAAELRALGMVNPDGAE